MRKSFVVLSGTGIRDTREWVPSATEALHLVRGQHPRMINKVMCTIDQAHMKLRRPSVRIVDERGNPVSFFQLKDAAELEAKKSPK